MTCNHATTAPAICTGGVFPQPTRHLLMAQMYRNERVLQLALSGDGCKNYIRICGGDFMDCSMHGEWYSMKTTHL